MLMTPQLTLLLERAVLGGYRMVVVDLSRCAFVGSAGLATFALARKRAQDGDTRTSLVLTGMSRIASRAMEVTGMGPLFQVYPSVAEALAALNRA
jgi:anti-anti-sigma factor